MRGGWNITIGNAEGEAWERIQRNFDYLRKCVSATLTHSGFIDFRYFTPFFSGVYDFFSFLF